jgi:hypothetical protein
MSWTVSDIIALLLPILMTMFIGIRTLRYIPWTMVSRRSVAARSIPLSGDFAIHLLFPSYCDMVGFPC